MTVMEVARTDVVTVDSEATLEDIAATMSDEDVGSVVVIDDDRPAGIVTDRDLVTFGFGGNRSPADTIANDIMAFDLFTVDADDGVFEVIRRMADAGVRRVPVVEDGQLAGIVTLDDFFVLLVNELENLASVVRAESPPYD